MDNKSDLKILTDTLLKVLASHTEALAAGVKGDILPHVKLLEGLMEKIQSYEIKSSPSIPSQSIGTRPIEVLNSIDSEIGVKESTKKPLEDAPEGPKTRYQEVPGNVELPDKKGASLMDIQDLTPDNIDNYSELMDEGSLPEPEITSPIKKK